jgi:hypothetical protein
MSAEIVVVIPKFQAAPAKQAGTLPVDVMYQGGPR